MKRNKVLIGLFVGVLALVGGSVKAQTDTNFFEIGPYNIGGKVNSLIVNQQDTGRTTVYAGAISGGLYLRSENVDELQRFYASRGITDPAIYGNTTMWHLVPFVQDGKTVGLPVNSLVQGPDNTIYIGTGDNTYQLGSTYTPMSTLGKGIFRFNPTTFEFTLIPNTVPSNPDDNFAAVNFVDFIYRDNVLYFFAVTNNGIYRWTISSESDWNSTPQCIYQGKVRDFQLVRSLKLAYFSVGSQLYKIGDVTITTPQCINISTSNSAFGGKNTAIQLAVAPSDPSYLYAMVIDSVGMMEALYLTKNQQDWERLTTSTVVPFTYNDGRYCGAMQVDPVNPKRIYIAGTSLWTGEGFLEQGYFQWTKTSYSEQELNYGNYMSTVYGNSMYVHSGIHQIIPSYRRHGDEASFTYYITTDGGIFKSEKSADVDATLNRFDAFMVGLNNIQVNGLAVCPDGAIVSGANSNSVPIVESRMAHFGGTPSYSWFDDGRLGNLNHYASVVWTGNGGHVATSQFQQISPLSRRNIFVSSENGQFGRAYADYLDYTNTQTWTIGSEFVSDEVSNGPEIGQVYLWETTNNTIFNSYTTYSIDTLGYLIRNGEQIPFDSLRVQLSDTSSNLNVPIQRGDKLVFLDRGHSEYPFEYTVTRNITVADTLNILNPIQSRMLVIGRTKGSTSKNAVFISWTPSDFSKVWNQEEFEAGRVDPTKYDRLMMWAPVLILNNQSNSERNLNPRTAAISSDGRFVYVAAQDLENNRSILYRVSGFEKADYTSGNKNIQSALTDPRTSTVSVLQIDTLYLDGSNYWFPRVISSIEVDNRSGNERLVLTFEGYSSDYANVAFVNNVTTDNYSIQTAPITAHASLPAYCSQVEKTTGRLYIGTANGVYVYNNGSWTEYDHLQGLAVTSIVQQKSDLPVRRHLGHTGINPNNYLFAKTKWPNAMYFGTYGRGIFLDMTYVTDRVNEISDPEDYEPTLDIPTVVSSDYASVAVYPNPVATNANLAISTSVAGRAMVQVYDLNGRRVLSQQIGHLAEGESTYTLDCSQLSRGMYLVNITVGNHTAATKMIVR